ncbi:ABC transporter permease [Gemmobacter lanyuensis]|uniref:ABC transporter permease n=1 Tax=Gemmobacter lanyuensis TaxID=1054497 RepID=A0A918MND9_9RHOB|nr:ABC transporter permease subunit [Gemmobacter lanyuensis]GGW41432.1 ABC transporter permease [Gemmobacter lanyuensis]
MAEISTPPTQHRLSRAGLAALLALGAIAVACVVLPLGAAGTPEAPALPIAVWVDVAMNWIVRDASLFGIAFSDLTRALATAAQWPIEVMQKVLAEGWVSGAGFNKRQVLPPASWLGVTLAASLLAWRLAGLRLGLFAAMSGIYLATFGLWTSAMMTLSSVLFCVLASLSLGLVLGIRAHRSPGIEPAVRAVMNIMQTVPTFSYLLPTLLLFGYGPSAALFATVAYAMPPMVHATVIALQSVPSDTLDLARMTGCSRRQTLWKVELPVAMPRLAIGLNQVVMMTLNMVIIASMIGAGGLGYDVLRALRRLDFGAAFEAGMAIVVLAVLLDRLTQALARQQSAGNGRGRAQRTWVVGLALILVPSVLSLFVPALALWPEAWTLSVAAPLNDAVSYINQQFYDPLEAIRTTVLLYVMNPIRDALQLLPWPLVIAATALGGWRLGGGRTAATVVVLGLFIVVTGYWSAAMGSLYLTLLSVILALAIGFPFGIWVAGRTRLQAGVQLFLDTLQTLPTLVYLLPAVMLFRNGDFSALIAILSYAVAPAVRYGIDGMLHVPSERIEAAAMSGCSRWQTFRHVRLPGALPTLLLGVNQTVMMALSMLVIAALVGTRELGQNVFTALSQGMAGPGIVAGLCVAALALIIDTILKAAAARATQSEGNSHV